MPSRVGQPIAFDGNPPLVHFSLLRNIAAVLSIRHSPVHMQRRDDPLGIHLGACRPCSYDFSLHQQASSVTMICTLDLFPITISILTLSLATCIFWPFCTCSSSLFLETTHLAERHDNLIPVSAVVTAHNLFQVVNTSWFIASNHASAQQDHSARRLRLQHVVMRLGRYVDSSCSMRDVFLLTCRYRCRSLSRLPRHA